ncbi:MAG TPA: ABC transporter ATP-binding protein [Coriobacteriaceae bacterium]|nr:ABC transporter ATP-binding protein [Coriobacteriaceae bacterium]
MYALAGVSFDVARGEFVAIMGPSGSGKTTMLNCISTIDRPSSGRILINGSDITTMSKGKLSAFRRDELGFIFQDSNLLDTLTGMENIALALTIKGTRPATITARVQDIARTLNVTESLKQYPNQMSGGQKQRVAAARAIVADPSLILADEPTGALDSRNATIMLETLEMLNKSLNATILMVTHDAYAASFSDRVLFLSDGKLFNEIRQGSLSREEYFARIMEVVTFLGGEAYHAA